MKLLVTGEKVCELPFSAEADILII